MDAFMQFLNHEHFGDMDKQKSQFFLYIYIYVSKMNDIKSKMNNIYAYLSRPGRSLTWNMPMTGRWSDVLMDKQDVYLTTLMSSACLFR